MTKYISFIFNFRPFWKNYQWYQWVDQRHTPSSLKSYRIFTTIIWGKLYCSIDIEQQWDSSLSDVVEKNKKISIPKIMPLTPSTLGSYAPERKAKYNKKRGGIMMHPGLSPYGLTSLAIMYDGIVTFYSWIIVRWVGTSLWCSSPDTHNGYRYVLFTFYNSTNHRAQNKYSRRKSKLYQYQKWTYGHKGIYNRFKFRFE